MSSSQDGGIGRKPLPPCTTKRRITTNLKSINNQKCQKIKLHGTPTTRKLKKKINQNNQIDKANSTGPLRKTTGRWLRCQANCQAQHSCEGGTDLRGKLRLRADCGLRLGLPRWEKLPVSQESSLKSALERSRLAALFPLWPLPHRQHHSAARRVALPWGEHLRPCPLTTYQVH